MKCEFETSVYFTPFFMKVKSFQLELFLQFLIKGTYQNIIDYILILMV